jgi:hypothetical protein
MTVTVAFSQKWFLREYPSFVVLNEAAGVSVIPESFMIHARVKTRAPISGDEVYDLIDLKVVSSGEDQAALCSTGFSSLTLETDTEMSGTRAWDVPEATKTKEPKNILLTPKLAEDTLASLDWECREQLYMTVDIQQPGKSHWTSIWNERDP